MDNDLTTPDPTNAELIAARAHLRRDALDGLMVESVPLAAIAAATGTPTWVLSATAMRARLSRLRAALGPEVDIHYAVKANDHLAVLRLLGQGGAGADVVSGGELRRALIAGIAPAHIVFSGVGKTRAEIAAALEAGIQQFNVESAEELEHIDQIAAAMGRIAPVALRVNPDVDAGTHAKITTGLTENKFGIAWQDAPVLAGRIAASPWLRPAGLAVHIGSQITTMAPFRAAFAKVAELVRALRAAGHEVARVDCGGGLGIGYRNQAEPLPEAYAATIHGAFAGMGLRLSVEPGRWIVGPAGLLLASVVLEKHTSGRRFVVLDAAMNDLLRPALYDAWHGIVPVGVREAGLPASAADVVGPVCETGDTFARDCALPRLTDGALVAILDAGAYGAVMSGTYNSRPLAAQVLVEGDRWQVIRPRQQLADLWAQESVPDWLRALPG